MMTQRLPSRMRQQGTALIVALVALVAMISAGFALFRSVDTVNLAANNYQFVKSAQQGVDLALNEALMGYMQSHPTVGLRVTDKNSHNAAASYFATQQAQNGDGIPLALANLAAPSWSGSGPAPTGWPGELIDNSSKQLRRYVIERMCNTVGIAVDTNCRLYTFEFAQNCIKQCESNSTENLPFVRITVRVDGPKNSVAYSQLFVKAE